MNASRKFKLLLLAALSSLAVACEQKQEQKQEAPVEEIPAPKVLSREDSLQLEVESVYKEIMVIHDRSMERMSEIRQLSTQLNDSIENTGVNPMEQEETINRYRNHLKELSDADQAMRQWMRQFSKGGEDLASEEKLEYLNEEKEKISRVDKQVNESIRSAQTVLRP